MNREGNKGKKLKKTLPEDYLLHKNGHYESCIDIHHWLKNAANAS